MATDPRGELKKAAYETWYDTYFGELLSDAMRTRWSALDGITKILVAATSSSSAIAGLALWKIGAFAWMWPTLTGISALLAILAERVGVASKLRDHGDSLNTYSALRIDLDTFRYRMKINRDFDVFSFEKELVTFRSRYGKAYLLQRSDLLLSDRLRRNVQEALNKKLT